MTGATCVPIPSLEGGWAPSLNRGSTSAPSGGCAPARLSLDFAHSALIALAFARLEDAEARRRSLNRFAIAHVVGGILFSGISSALLTPMLPEIIVWAPLVVGIVLSSFAIVNAQAQPSGHTSVDVLRSRYEAQIREAARREERARLARDLHDAVKQQLFVIQTAGATAQARFDADAPGARAALEQVRTAAREAMTEMEAMLDQLQSAPISNAGLVAF